VNSFFDAGGWLSAASQSDQHHRAGKAHYAALLTGRARLITTDFVLDEVLTRLRYDAGHGKAVEFLDHIRQAERAGLVLVRRIDEDLWMKAKRSSAASTTLR